MQRNYSDSKYCTRNKVGAANNACGFRRRVLYAVQQTLQVYKIFQFTHQVSATLYQRMALLQAREHHSFGSYRAALQRRDLGVEENKL